ncbi:MAG: hypothetical protein A2516_08385 [Alphaproteobacteria bacterium RIFOXYD12_FULL_60_8]|nr:MAG: hypothetical protein A2516_08385 [Alphaproteobacteria bacterium RIFOXYD12_FULL_60_8]
MRTALIAAANDGHFSLLEELLLSVRAAAPPGGLDQIDLCVLDLGLTAEQQTRIDHLADQRVIPGWDVDFPGREDMPGWFRAMTARPFLPNHFPDYDVYLWLDADTWVQDFFAIELLIRAGSDYGLGIVPEIDRSYGSLYGMGNARANAEACYKEAFGEDVGERLTALPLLNSGVLAISARSGVWAAWREILRRALSQTSHKLVEQASLNLAIYQGGLGVHYLPSICNWLCVLGPPRIDPVRKLYVEPYLPFATLGILHLTALTHATVDTFTTTGQPITTSLRYKDLDVLRALL